MTSTAKRDLLAISGLLLLAWGHAQPQTTIRIEAEDMRLDTYIVEAQDFASNGALINLKGPGITGSASAAFPGPTGNFDITVVYYDENDGDAQLSVLIEGEVVDSWTLDQLVAGSRHATVSSRFARQVATNHTISNGDEIQIYGLQGLWDHANVDYIEFVGLSAPPTPDNFAFVAKSGGNYDDPVAALDDSDSWCNSPSRESPCTLFIGPGRYVMQRALDTQDLINVSGAGQSATILTRGELPGLNDCESEQEPTIRHAAGFAMITDISIISECGAGGINVELIDGQLVIERAIIDSPGQLGSVYRAIAARSSGALTLNYATIDGYLVSENGFLEINDSTVDGFTEYHALVQLSESSRSRVSNSRFSGIHNAAVFSNAGDLEIRNSTISAGQVGTGITNTGTLLMMSTTITGIQSELIGNSGEAVVHHSLFDSLVEPDNGADAYVGLIHNSRGSLAISHSVLKNTEVADDTGGVKCLFVSDGNGNELGSDCSVMP